MRGGIVYEERIVSRVMVIVFLLVLSLLLIMLLYFLSLPGETVEWVIMMYLSLILLFIFIGFNFSIFAITVTPDNLIIHFGMFKKKIKWADIKNYKIIEASWTKFGGLGIRVTKMDGKTTLAYVVEGSTKIALEIVGHKYQMFVFSTRKPEELMNIIRQKVELHRA